MVSKPVSCLTSRFTRLADVDGLFPMADDTFDLLLEARLADDILIMEGLVQTLSLMIYLNYVLQR